MNTIVCHPSSKSAARSSTTFVYQSVYYPYPWKHVKVAMYTPSSNINEHTTKDKMFT